MKVFVIAVLVDLWRLKLIARPRMLCIKLRMADLDRWT